MNEFLIISGMAIATFVIRYSMFGASHRIVLSPTLLKALRYVPPVVLTAIVIPEVLISEGSLAIGYGNARLVGAITAILISLITKNLLLTIVLGMASFFGWQAALSLLS
ncbi:AzlD domain-containing protein [cf. Phormidesmis sp. LEGE 11477]|uniref:AzlD domain-containing protein n=1 Tax=cf. Phormidesmis sp. LEGE 11477 TaxID=1828680 RepID=UPI00188079B4|nr:AzlD domain-containing protein [cf. Phormidesmis sp. LEGE 11477]MBE9059529.1 AzlD domain-containing protein [cf. Phormidesmis sp. LEGE 11477]